MLLRVCVCTICLWWWRWGRCKAVHWVSQLWFLCVCICIIAACLRSMCRSTCMLDEAVRVVKNVKVPPSYFPSAFSLPVHGRSAGWLISYICVCVCVFMRTVTRTCRVCCRLLMDGRSPRSVQAHRQIEWQTKWGSCVERYTLAQLLVHLVFLIFIFYEFWAHIFLPLHHKSVEARHARWNREGLRWFWFFSSVIILHLSTW